MTISDPKFESEVADRFRQELHTRRMKVWPSRWRALLLRLALGTNTFNYLVRSIKNDPRTPGRTSCGHRRTSGRPRDPNRGGLD